MCKQDICKLLWIRVSANVINVNVFVWCFFSLKSFIKQAALLKSMHRFRFLRASQKWQWKRKTLRWHVSLRGIRLKRKLIWMTLDNRIYKYLLLQNCILWSQKSNQCLQNQPLVHEHYTTTMFCKCLPCSIIGQLDVLWRLCQESDVTKQIPDWLACILLTGDTWSLLSFLYCVKM